MGLGPPGAITSFDRQAEVRRCPVVDFTSQFIKHGSIAPKEGGPRPTLREENDGRFERARILRKSVAFNSAARAGELSLRAASA
jgi:hypothetical protein